MPKPSFVWSGPEVLRKHLLPIDRVSSWPGNPKDHDLGALSESLRRFGQQRPILVQESTGFVVAGNGTRDAAIALGWTHIAAIVSDLSDRDAKAFNIADNRLHDLGGYFDDRLAVILTELRAESNLDAIGYDSEDIDALIASLSPFVPDDVAQHSEPGEGFEVLIEVRASRAFLEEVKETLAEWERRSDVFVSIA